jgi:two-component system, NtrC family, response regulator AtoC
MSNDAARLRVLVVDDEPLIVWSLVQTLSTCGEIVSEAGTGEAALQSLGAEPEPDVVLLDFHLPDSSDLRLLSTVKRLAPHSHVILMSAYCTPEMRENALAVGAYRVVGKPLDMNDVPAMVREAAGVRPH